MRLYEVALLAGALFMAMPSHARAEDADAGATPPPTAPTAAQTLFREGRALLERGEIEAACTKLEGSFKLEPTAMGTLFNLALCNERRGRFATAWAQHMDVLAASRDSRPDRAALAEQLARALEPRLSRIRIAVSKEANIPGLRVELDHVELPASGFDTGLPVDGGEHVVSASAEGHAQSTQRVRVASERDLVTVTVVPLSPLPAPPPKPPERTGELAARPRGGSPALGVAFVAAGAAAIATGAAFGLKYLDDVDKAQAFVDQHPNAYDEMKGRVPTTGAWVANVTIPVGLLLVGLGAFQLVRSKPSQPAAASR